MLFHLVIVVIKSCAYFTFLSLDKTSHWLDGSDVTFFKWADKKKSGNGKCGILFASNETWKNVECTDGYGRVVCKSPLGK